MQPITLSWGEVQEIASRITQEIKFDPSLTKVKFLYGVPRGGIPVAIMVSVLSGLPLLSSLQNHTPEEVLVLDDIVDSGTTRQRFQRYPFRALVVKETNAWIEFPWETMAQEAPAQDAVTRILQAIGEDPTREGLVDTPNRVVKSWDTLFKGYTEKPEDFIKVFEANGYDEIVLLKDIEMYSTCEHHMLPFIGKAHVAYIPDQKVIGISKLARIVEMYSRRLQIQERLAQQVADCVMEYLQPKAAACIVEARHLCMSSRGVQKQNSSMITSCLRGAFLTNQAAREELMRLIQ